MAECLRHRYISVAHKTQPSARAQELKRQAPNLSNGANPGTLNIYHKKMRRSENDV